MKKINQNLTRPEPESSVRKRKGIASAVVVLGAGIALSLGFVAISSLRSEGVSPKAPFAPTCASCSYVPNSQVGPIYPTCVEQVVTVQTGQAIQISRDTPLPTDSTAYWGSDFGYMSQSGLYVAPITVPSGQLDFISYTDQASGVSFTIPVRVVPNVGAPVSPMAPVISEVSSPSSSGMVGGGQTPGIIQSPTGSMESSPIAVTDGSPNPNEFSNPVAISPSTVDGKTAYQMPLVDNGDSGPSGTIYGSTADAEPLMMSCRGPQYAKPSWAGTACSGGTQLVTGPVSSGYIKSTAHDTLTITTELAAKILGWGGSVQVHDVVQASYDVFKLHRWENADVYHCVNGVWTYWYTEHCSQNTTEDGNFVPSWYYHILGLPSDPYMGTWMPPNGFDCGAI